jgi:DNA transposition AAA+ family ATPase
MKPIIAQVSNVTNASTEYRAAWKDDTANPRMLLFEGFTGAGKSTTLASLLNRYADAIYIRMTSVMTCTTLSLAILRELDIDTPRRSLQENLEVIAERMNERQVALFIDEADYAFKNNRLIDLIRDIYDLTNLPVVLVGMDGIGKKLGNNKQLDRRVTRRVRFQSLNRNDGRVLADSLCDVRFEDDLVDHYLEKVKGSIALAVVALAKIEKYAKKQGYSNIGLAQWSESNQSLALNAEVK